jgi:hypothetical protein
MEPPLVAGERVELLRGALRKFGFTTMLDGKIRVSVELPVALGTPLARALTRIDRELSGRERVGHDRVRPRPQGNVRAEALVVLANVRSLERLQSEGGLQHPPVRAGTRLTSASSRNSASSVRATR